MAYGDNYNNSKAARRRRRRRRKILQAVIPVAIAVILIVVVVIVAISTGLFDSFAYSSKKADLTSYFQMTSADTATVVLDNGDITTDRITVKDGHLYSDLDTVLSNFNDNFYWEQTSGRLLYTTGEGVYATVPDTTYYSMDGAGTQTGYTTCYLNGETLMICLDYVRQFTNFEYTLCGGSGEPYRVLIKNQWGTKELAKVSKDDVAVRLSADKEADILKNVNEGVELRVQGEENDEWLKVTTDDLITGYIEKKHMGDSYSQVENPVTDVQPISVATVADYSEPIVLAWHNVTNEESAKYLSDYNKYLSDINVISPTWFALADDEGTVASIASESYVSMCHDKGIKVWGLVDNMTYEVSSYTILSNPDKRAYVISQLLALATQYNLDGINVDFEMITEDAGPGFVQFVRELCLAAHKQNLVISVDNYVPQGYTLHYDRQEQGVFADYVIIMGYDEHTSGSDEAGSVASIDFVLKGIEQTLDDVPANKVINGVPFYARLWTVDDAGMITDLQTVPMDVGVQAVANAGATKTWDELTNQNYAEWPANGGTNKIWLEDADSLRAKLEVMKNKGIAGVAVWQLAYSTDYAWEVINEYYNP